MAFFDTMANTTDENATATLYALVKGLGAKVTYATVKEELSQHPDFPSLLSLSDLLTDWQIDNTALQLNTPEQLYELPLPFVAHFHKNGGWYVLVTALTGDRITYSENTQGRKTDLLTDFEKNWSGIVLLAEANKLSGESDYAIKRQNEELDELRNQFTTVGIGLIFLIAILSIGSSLLITDWILLVTKSVGLVINSLLVVKQLGSTNSLIDRLYRINSKTNCDDVPNSPAIKLWGWLRWTDVGLLYFSGGLITVLAIGFQSAVRPLLSGLALLALPYTLFSVYYQARVIRQWCSSSLAVQAVLLIEGILAAIQLNSLPDFVQPYLLILIAFLLPTLVWLNVRPLLSTLSKSRREHQELKRFKRDRDLFRLLLLQQSEMPPIPNDLRPIVLGNPDAEHTITMVTNPYCGPCGREHIELEQLFQQNQNVKANIIFTGDGADGPATQVALHALALVKQGNIAEALINWYRQKEKKYDAWTKRYPTGINKSEMTRTLKQHRQWCRLAGITDTPTVYVAGHQLPELYQLSQLRWLISHLPDTIQTKDLAKSR
jgi:uncharacterized membrane protein